MNLTANQKTRREKFYKIPFIGYLVKLCVILLRLPIRIEQILETNQELNKKLKGKLDLTIKIFENKYKKKFLHQLISSEIDLDRLDYLKRDSFYTGVIEGNINVDRIIKMFNVSKGDLVIEHKGIHSIDKFLKSRDIMYWQVYYHKNVLVAEKMLISILKRIKELKSHIKYPETINFFIQNAYKKLLYIQKRKFTLNLPKES